MTEEIDIQDFLRIELIHARGSKSFDPNSLIHAFFDSPAFMDGWLPTERVSMLSGKPGFIYKTMEVELCLTADEIRRLTYRSLNPVEFMILKKLCKQGLTDNGTLFFEIHGDIYDPETGEAFQPKE